VQTEPDSLGEELFQDDRDDVRDDNRNDDEFTIGGDEDEEKKSKVDDKTFDSFNPRG